MTGLLAYRDVHHVHAWFLWKPEEGVWPLGNGTADGCEPGWCWGLSPGPLEEQQMNNCRAMSLISDTLLYTFVSSCRNWPGAQTPSRCCCCLVLPFSFLEAKLECPQLYGYECTHTHTSTRACVHAFSLSNCREGKPHIITMHAEMKSREAKETWL